MMDFCIYALAALGAVNLGRWLYREFKYPGTPWRGMRPYGWY
jgi:hypothetical protein